MTPDHNSSHALDLYIQISNMKWNYEPDADAHSTKKVSGTIFLEETIKQFEFDRSQISDFDLTNSLWALLDS